MRYVTLTAVCVLAASSLLAQPGAGRAERRGEAGRARAAVRADRETTRPRAWEPGERMRAFAQRRDVPTSRILQRMKDFLALTPDQESKAREILEKAKSEVGESVGSLRELGEKTREKLREILTEEQRIKLDKLRKDAREVGAQMMQERGPQMREALGRAGEEARLRMALRAVNLTEEQRKKVQEIEKETHAKLQAIQNEVRPKIEATREEA
ncbi:MAG: hypothetical protein ACPL7D_12065, partial [Candidatus Sumerlaeaceae bacterium]